MLVGVHGPAPTTSDDQWTTISSITLPNAMPGMTAGATQPVQQLAS
jgi:ABC-type molybdate transport system permease subunit